MANELLKFRRGTYAQINAAERVNGTIYVATDEKALYVDTATERIRIGDFIRVSTVKDITPPYSTSSLYYVEADNALLKYVETEVDGVKTGSWKQVNGTDELQTALNSLTNRVSAAEGKVSTLEGKMSTAEGKITAIENKVGKAAEGENAATGLFAAIADNAAEIEELKTVVGGTGNESLGARMTQAENDIDALENTVASHTGKISALETESAKHALKTDLDAYAKTDDIQSTLDKVDTTNGVTAAINAAVLGEENRAKGVEKTLSENIASVRATANSAVQTETFETWKTTNTADIAAAKNGAIESAGEYTDNKISAEVERADGKYATKTALEATNNAVAGHTAEINALKGTGTGSVKEAKDRADAAYALAEQKATIEEVKALNYATKDEAQGYANAKDASIKAAADAAAAAKAKADSAYDLANGKTTTEDVKTQIEAYGYATTQYVDQAEADAVAAAKTAADKAYAPKSVIDTVSGHTAALNILNGTEDVEGSVAEAKKAGDDAQKAIDDWKTAHQNDYTNTQIDNKVADAKKAGTDAGTQAETNRQSIASIKATVDKLDGTVTTEGSVKKQIKDAVNAAKTALSEEIDADIRAANAMEYVATISSSSQLPATAKNGATYVIGSAFGAYAAGDMLIAQGTEDPDTGLITNPTWAHVKSGYDATLDQKLTGTDNKIKLSTGVGLAGTEIAFTSTGSASVAVANNTVTVGIVWDDFT